MNLQPYFQEMRRVIRERGWIQGDYATDEGVCLVGAAQAVCYRRRQSDAVLSVGELHDALIAKMASALPQDGVTWLPLDAVTSWNDDAERTDDDVDAFLARLASPPVVEDVEVVKVVEEEMVCA